MVYGQDRVLLSAVAGYDRKGDIGGSGSAGGYGGQCSEPAHQQRCGHERQEFTDDVGNERDRTQLRPLVLGDNHA